MAVAAVAVYKVDGLLAQVKLVVVAAAIVVLVTMLLLTRVLVAVAVQLIQVAVVTAVQA